MLWPRFSFLLHFLPRSYRKGEKQLIHFDERIHEKRIHEVHVLRVTWLKVEGREEWRKNHNPWWVWPRFLLSLSKVRSLFSPSSLSIRYFPLFNPLPLGLSRFFNIQKNERRFSSHLHTPIWETLLSSNIHFLLLLLVWNSRNHLTSLLTFLTYFLSHIPVSLHIISLIFLK